MAILVAGFGPDTDRLASLPKEQVQRLDAPEEALGALKAADNDVALVILGPHVMDPLVALRRIKAACPEVLVLLVATPHAMPALQHALLLTPQIGEPARVLQENDDLPRLLLEHASWARARRRNRSALQRANAELEPSDVQEREPPAVLDELLERAPVAVILLDDEGSVVHENSQARSLLPRRNGSLRFIDRVPVGARPVFEKLLSEHDATSSARIDLPSRGGKMRHHDASVTRVQLARRRQGCLLLIQDVTQIVLAQRELEEARAELAQAEKFATIGSLVGGLAHEIRTPLTLLQNNINILESRISRATTIEQLRAEAPALLGGAMDGADRIHGLVRDLRRFLRGDEPRFRDSSLSEPVSAAVRLFNATHPAAPRVETHLTATRLLQLDPSQIQQVVINLLENAADASSDRSRVRITTRDMQGGSELVVQDWGVGIPADVQERMFETFITTKPDGNGLGLNIVRRIVELHRATIRVESRVGSGTRFILTFPTPNGGTEKAAAAAGSVPARGE